MPTLLTMPLSALPPLPPPNKFICTSGSPKSACESPGDARGQVATTTSEQVKGKHVRVQT